MVVGQHVAAGQRGGHGGHHLQNRGLLGRGVAADPGRGRDRHVALVVADRAGPERDRMQVGDRRQHRQVLGQPHRLGHLGQHGADDRAHRQHRWQLGQRGAGQLDQPVVVPGLLAAVVGQPRQGHRQPGGGHAAGEPGVEVVEGLDEGVGLLVELLLVFCDVETVAQRVVALGARYPGRPPDPGRRLGGPEPLDRQAAAHLLGRQVRTAGVHPQHAVADRVAMIVDRHGGAPLAGDRDGHQRCGGVGVAPGQLGGAVGDRGPPLVGVLDGGAVGCHLGLHPAVDRPDDRAAE